MTVFSNYISSIARSNYFNIYFYYFDLDQVSTNVKIKESKTRGRICFYPSDEYIQMVPRAEWGRGARIKLELMRYSRKRVEGSRNKVQT